MQLVPMPDEVAKLRAFVAAVETYATLPAPTSAGWGEYERENRMRLFQVAQLCRAVVQSDALPLSLDQSINVLRALNVAPLPYEAGPTYSHPNYGAPLCEFCGTYHHSMHCTDVDEAPRPPAPSSQPYPIGAAPIVRPFQPRRYET